MLERGEVGLVAAIGIAIGRGYLTWLNWALDMVPFAVLAAGGLSSTFAFMIQPDCR
jgi:hypothetical protein